MPSLAGLSALPPKALARILAEDSGRTAQWVFDAACLGLVEAQTTLGQMLLDGRGTPADGGAARRWFMLAAQASHAPAANMLGRCLERGWGGEPDFAQAARWYRCAAEASLDWGQYNLANMLLRGRGVAQDKEQAFVWFLKAAEQGHAKSMNLVGRFLEEGWIAPVDTGAAAAWYRRAAEGGDFRGQYNLATLLAQSGSLAEAVTWFNRAGEAGSQDFRRLAAEQLLLRPEPALRGVGLSIAARCCDGGQGVDFHRYGVALAQGPDARLTLALAWLRRAAAAGYDPAVKDIAWVQAELTRTALSRWRAWWWRLTPCSPS
jgi:uncharacterized protein